jgi:hypothetical protein
MMNETEAEFIIQKLDKVELQHIKSDISDSSSIMQLMLTGILQLWFSTCS